MTAATKEKPKADFLEPHYTLAELAEAWHMSERTLRDWFVGEIGVIRFGVPRLRKQKKRAYVSLRIPQSVAERVYYRITGKQIYPTGGNCPMTAP